LGGLALVFPSHPTPFYIFSRPPPFKVERGLFTPQKLRFCGGPKFAPFQSPKI
jgi:hypothetical protein